MVGDSQRSHSFLKWSATKFLVKLINEKYCSGEEHGKIKMQIWWYFFSYLRAYGQLIVLLENKENCQKLENLIKTDYVFFRYF